MRSFWINNAQLKPLNMNDSMVYLVTRIVLTDYCRLSLVRTWILGNIDKDFYSHSLYKCMQVTPVLPIPDNKNKFLL